MFRFLLISIFLFSFLAGVHAQNAQQDYIDQLIKLSELTSNQQYREAINGYRRLEAQPGAPEWLKAGCAYEIAELYGTLNENANASAALSRAVQFGYDDCLSPRASEHLGTVLRNPTAIRALAGMTITESDFRELVWLKSEVEHAEHDARMMITDNINRVDQQDTEIPQAQMPTRPTISRSFVLAGATAFDPKSAKRVCEEVRRGAYGACRHHGSDQWSVFSGSAGICSSCARNGGIAESGNPQACLRRGEAFLGSAKAVYRVGRERTLDEYAHPRAVPLRCAAQPFEFTIRLGVR